MQMELIEALKILAAPAAGTPVEILLATGFQPLHLKTFVAARLRRVFPGRPITIHTGLYGDLLGALKKAKNGELQAAIVVIEWFDLDPRLSLRSLGGWNPRDLEDILIHARSRADQLESCIREAAHRTPIALCLPTLPLPPASYAPGWEASGFELELRECASGLASKLSRIPNVRIVNSQRLDRLSPLAERFNVKSELQFGFPYELSHAGAVAELLSLLVQAKPPKKGLITDLDNTLWAGIAGEDGPNNVSWDLDHHSQMHGVYQQVLRSLAESGVLIAAASKNDEEVVAGAFRRKDLILPEQFVYPMEIHWRPKSESVARILKTWNIAADSAVFVDDSTMEVAEVKHAFPDLQCLQFPSGTDDAIYRFLENLRDLFGKSHLSEEDSFRLESIRNRAQRTEAVDRNTNNGHDFAAELDGQLELDFTKSPLPPRALELVNKTNQFNLNGHRFTEGEWINYLERPETILALASYRDRFGPLGRIAVITGTVNGDSFHVDNWVMSCRAFSRGIEYSCLSDLAARFAVNTFVFNFAPTPRNLPLQSFFSKLIGAIPQGSFGLRGDLVMHRLSALDVAEEAQEFQTQNASTAVPSSAYAT
jgi:FkbH-like protein